MKSSKKKSILLGVLVFLVLGVAVAYATLSQSLTINGTAKVQSDWKVEITNIAKKASASATEAADPTYSATTASFSVNLEKPGAYIEYDVTVENKGTIDAKLNAIQTQETGTYDDVVFTITPSAETVNTTKPTLAAQATTTFTVRAEWVASSTVAPEETVTRTVTYTLDYVQA